MPTIITRTIGVGKNYPSIAAWLAGADTTYPSGLVAADVVWKGELYKEGPGTNGEWAITSEISITTICDATRYLWLTAAPGASFRDSANKLTNALRYNNANGVAVSTSVNTLSVFSSNAASNNQKLVFTGIQFKGTGSGYFAYFNNGAVELNSCILEYDNVCSYGEFSAVNSIIFSKAPNMLFQQWGRVSASIRNCTLIGTGSSSNAIYVFEYSGSLRILKNNAIFGFSSIASDPGNKIDAANSTHNVTDLASFGWTATGNIVSKTFANQFQNIGSGTEDFRVKAGADLINAGVRDQTYTSDLDIVGTTRSLTTPTIGAWEYPTITYTYARPSSDVTTQWTPSTGTSHFALIDEVTYDDADYIFATAAGQTDEVKLATMSAPKAGTSVDVQYRVTSISGGGKVTLSLVCNTTVIATDTIRSADGDYVLTVAPATWAAVTDWSNMRLRFVSS